MKFLVEVTFYTFIFAAGLVVGEINSNKPTLNQISVQESCNPNNTKCFYRCSCNIMEVNTIENPLGNK